MNIAIDGPAGSGKSTVAKIAAKELGFIYVDTGAMYRAMAYYCLQHGIDPKAQDAVEENCDKMDVSICYVSGEQQVLLNGEDVSKFIRTEEVSHATSVISAYPKVRETLLGLQRELAATRDVIMDGRDIGTNVLPHAECKIFLTASVETRANRRYLEYKDKGETCDLEEIKKEIAERDARDMNREIAPLKQAEDATLLDTSNLDIQQVVAVVKELAKKHA